METTKESHAYQMGRDYILNGPNTTNCHFSLFSSTEGMKEWERGKEIIDSLGVDVKLRRF